MIQFIRTPMGKLLVAVILIGVLYYLSRRRDKKGKMAWGGIFGMPNVTADVPPHQYNWIGGMPAPSYVIGYGDCVAGGIRYLNGQCSGGYRCMDGKWMADIYCP